MRTIAAVVLSTGIVLSLAACSSPSNSVEGCAPTPSGNVSSAVTATGDFGAISAVSTPSNLFVETTERSVLLEGTGTVARTGDVVSGTGKIIDGKTGQVAQEGQILITLVEPAEGETGPYQGFLCSREGDRVAFALPTDTSEGKPSTAVVAVFDVTDVYPGRATGTSQLATNGFPAVTTDATGRPGITIPSGAVPTEPGVAVLKSGDGAEVALGDNVLVQYTSVDWASGSVIGSTWENEAAGIATIAEGATDADGVPLGFPLALAGAQVGSQLIVLVPSGDGATALISVVDILAVLPATAG